MNLSKRHLNTSEGINNSDNIMFNEHQVDSDGGGPSGDTGDDGGHDAGTRNRI